MDDKKRTEDCVSGHEKRKKNRSSNDGEARNDDEPASKRPLTICSDEWDHNDVFSVLLATDCHIGFLEKDLIRGQDSFKTFEEVLKQAVEYDVDFILLGGDLFHANKPSRTTLYKTSSLLRKYCMGDRPSRIEFLGDQSENIRYPDVPVANFEDPNFKISYPVFSVHGNHDDPTGESNLSAIDIPGICGLLNHFGKVSSVDNIEIRPLLLRKGQTKLALYGLGSVRDERLCKTYMEGKVKMTKPNDGPESWFNLFVIHQNRYSRGSTSYIEEDFLDDFLDLVVWGHEHECLIDPVDSPSGKKFKVTQPGSSVATSLISGESRPKHIGLLKIHKKEFKLKKIPLKTVRPLFFEKVVLSQTNLNPGSEDALTEFLKEKVESILQHAQIDNGMRPLVRLKVDKSGGYGDLIPHKFGQKFVDRVANPKDILHFVKSETDADKSHPPVRDGIDGLRLENVINELCKESDERLQLKVLPKDGLEKALKSFVNNEQKGSIKNFVEQEIKKFVEVRVAEAQN